MKISAQSGRERFRWDEFLPVRGKWARHLLVVPLALVLWAASGVRWNFPGGVVVVTSWEYWPPSWPSPDGPNTFVDYADPRYERLRRGWGRAYRFEQRVGWYVFHARYVRPMDDAEVTKVFTVD